MMSLILNVMPPPVFKIPISSHRSSLFYPPGITKSFEISGNCINFCPSIAFRGFVVAKVKVHPIRKKKRRLDEVCADRFHNYSRSFLRSWIMQGNIRVDGKTVHKAGTLVHDIARIEIKDKFPKYVCRGGNKLEAAIEELGVDVSGKVALDSGLSTGGFTDCLLQYGASFVYGVDVGFGQTKSGDMIKLMKDEATLVALVKPQFEAGRSQVNKGGIVKDPAVHEEVIEKIKKGVEAFGFHTNGCIPSPLKGAKGNQEFFISFTRGSSPATSPVSPPTTETSSTTEPVVPSIPNLFM